MAKDIMVSHDGAIGCKCRLKFDLQFDNLSHWKFQRAMSPTGRIH
jgi:hypothetical protein